MLSKDYLLFLKKVILILGYFLTLSSQVTYTKVYIQTRNLIVTSNVQTLEHILATEENPGNHKMGKKSDAVFCVT